MEVDVALESSLAIASVFLEKKETRLQVNSEDNGGSAEGLREMRGMK